MALSERCMFAFPIYSDVGLLYTPTFSGGSWLAALPLTNLADRRLAKVARSTTAAVAYTTFDCDLKAARYVSLVALPKHTISTAGKVRVRGFTTVPILDALDFSTGWTSVGTPTRSAAALTCTDGVPLDLIGDDDGAAQEYYSRVVTFTGNAQKIVTLRVSKGTIIPGTGARVQLNDGVDRLFALITWSGTVPSVAMTTGTLVSSTLIGGAEYRLIFLTTAVTAAATNTLELLPASTVAEQGNIYCGDVSAYNAATDQLAYEGGNVAAWPTIAYPTDSVASTDPRYGAAYSAEDALSVPMPFVTIPSAPVTAQYWRVGITDTTNAAGYVDVARLVIAGGYQPSLNVAYGAKLGWTTATTRVETDGGAAVFNAKPQRRVLTAAIDNLPLSEAMISPYEMERSLGLSGQLFFVFDPTATALMSRQAFLAVLRELNPMEYVSLARYGVPVSLVEEL